jgi:hypothetical protein
MLRLAEVADGKAGDFVAPGQDAVRALDRPTRLLVELADFFQIAGAQGPHGLRIGLGDRFRALHDDGLEEFGAHDGAHPGPSAGPAFQASDNGIPDHIFAALADIQDADPFAVFGVDKIVGGISALAPNLLGGEEFDVVVLDIKHRRPISFAFDDQSVITGFP